MWVSRAGGGKEVNEVWSKPLISFQRLPNIMGTWCKAFLPSLPRLYILKTMDPRQEPQPPRSYQRVWQVCEVLTSEDCSEVMRWRRFADSIRTLCSVHHKKGTFLGVTSTVQITPFSCLCGQRALLWPLLRASHWVPMTIMRWSCLGQSQGNRCVLDRSLLPQVDKSPSGGTGMGGVSYVFLYPMRPWEISKDESFSTIRNTNTLWLVICGHHPLSIPRSLCFLFKPNGCATCSSQQSWTSFDFLTLVPASHWCSLSPASLLPSIVSS